MSRVNEFFNAGGVEIETTGRGIDVEALKEASLQARAPATKAPLPANNKGPGVS